MREIVHRIDAPLGAGAMMFGVQNAVHHRIAHVQVLRSHVDLGPQRARAVWKFAGAHALKQVQILCDGPVAPGALRAGFGQRSAILPHLIRGKIANISAPGQDQLHRPYVQLVEVVGRIEEPVFPVASQPANVFDNRIDILGLFLRRIGVVEAQVALTAKLRGEPKVEIDRFGVANVQISVRLRRKARMHAATVFVGR